MLLKTTLALCEEWNVQAKGPKAEDQLGGYSIAQGRTF